MGDVHPLVAAPRTYHAVGSLGKRGGVGHLPAPLAQKLVDLQEQLALHLLQPLRLVPQVHKQRVLLQLGQVVGPPARVVLDVVAGRDDGDKDEAPGDGRGPSGAAAADFGGIARAAPEKAGLAAS